MEKRRRKPLTLTAEQFEVFRTRLDERGKYSSATRVLHDGGDREGRIPAGEKLRENGYTLKMLVRVLKRTASQSNPRSFDLPEEPGATKGKRSVKRPVRARWGHQPLK